MPHAAPRAPPNNLCFTSSIIFPDTKLLLTRKHRPKYTQSNLYFARMSAESMLLLRLYGQTGYLLTLPRSLLKNDQPTQHADPALLTRRQWLGRLPAPAIAPTLGAGFLGENSAGQSPCLHSRSRNSRLQRPKLRRKGRWRHPRHSSISGRHRCVSQRRRRNGSCSRRNLPHWYRRASQQRPLHIAAAGKVLGSGDGKQYHAVDAIPLTGDSTLEDGNYALLFAVNAKNVTVEGPGTVDGQGAQFHSAVRGTPPPSGLGGLRRPYQILAYRCEDLTVRNLSLLDCAYHSIRVIQSKRVHMDGLYVHDRVNGNNDGFHFISAEYVTVSNCTVLSQDDACALFGSCKFVTVTNCVFSTRWSVFRFGGGVAENISISNCVLYDVFGCPIKFHGKPGSRYENMSFSNLVLKDVTGPIHISIGPIGAPQSIRRARHAAGARTVGPIQSGNRPQHLLQQHPRHRHHQPATTPRRHRHQQLQPRRAPLLHRAQRRRRIDPRKYLLRQHPPHLRRRRHSRGRRATRSSADCRRVLHARSHACLRILRPQRSRHHPAKYSLPTQPTGSAPRLDPRSCRRCRHLRPQRSRQPICRVAPALH